MAYQTIKHALLGNLVPTQGPFATYFHADRDDFDLSLYTEGPLWLIKIEADYWSSITGELETVEKELALDKRILEARGRGAFINRFEELYDGVAKDQLTFLPHDMIVLMRNAIMHLLQEAYARIDSGENPDGIEE